MNFDLFNDLLLVGVEDEIVVFEVVDPPEDDDEEEDEDLLEDGVEKGESCFDVVVDDPDLIIISTVFFPTTTLLLSPPSIAVEDPLPPLIDKLLTNLKIGNNILLQIHWAEISSLPFLELIQSIKSLKIWYLIEFDVGREVNLDDGKEEEDEVNEFELLKVEFEGKGDGSGKGRLAFDDNLEEEEGLDAVEGSRNEVVSWV